jgi:DNA-directed RNA polymerase subunit RPC12/RpoP
MLRALKNETIHCPKCLDDRIHEVKATSIFAVILENIVVMNKDLMISGLLVPLVGWFLLLPLSAFMLVFVTVPGLFVLLTLHILTPKTVRQYRCLECGKERRL